MKKRIISMIVLAAVTASLFSACKKKEVQTEAAISTNDGPLSRYETTVELTAVGSITPPESKKVPSGTTVENQSFLKLAEDNLNIKIKYLWTVPAEQFGQKFKLSVASGELPDIMKIDQQQFEEFIESDSLADLTKAYEKYALPEMKADYQAFDNAPLKAATRNGKLYSLPYNVDPNQQIQLIWIRTDWLKNVGLEPPKTIDDVVKIAEAFAKKDPDKNGKNDTYGLALNKDIFSWAFDVRGFAQGFHAYPNGWIKGKSGTLVKGEIQPEMKNVLLKLQEMYKNNIIDREYAVKDINKVTEDLVAGKIGITYGEWWLPNWPLNLNKDKDPNAEWECFPIVSVDDKPAVSNINRINFGGYNVVSKKTKNPEAAIKLMNLYWDIMFGKEKAETKYGELVKDEKGFVYNFVPIYNFRAMTQDNNFLAVNEALKAKSPSNLITEDQNNLYEAAIKYLENKKLTKEWGLYYSRAAENGGWGITRKIRDAKQVIYNEYYGSTTATELEKGQTLDKLISETFNRIIMGAPINEFDKFVDDWKKLGGDEITKEVNEWYNKNK